MLDLLQEIDLLGFKPIAHIWRQMCTYTVNIVKIYDDNN